MKNKYLLLFVCLLIVFTSGCGLAVKQIASTARGGYSDLLVIKPVENLQGFSSIEFKSFSSDINDKISSELLNDINNKVATELSKSGFNKSGGKTLIFSGSVIHINSSLLSKNIIVKVELIDKTTSQSLGMANISGQAEGACSLKAAASGIASGIINLLNKYQIPSEKKASYIMLQRFDT
jgi:hypothetical protein